MKKLILFVVVVAVLAGAYILIPKQDDAATVEETAIPSTSLPPSPQPSVGVRTHTVLISNFAFSPASVRVAKGDVVVFTNQDAAPHTATSTTGAFNSGILQKSVSWTLTTEGLAPGTYPFYCELHPSMRGELIIE